MKWFLITWNSATHKLKKKEEDFQIEEYINTL